MRPVPDVVVPITILDGRTGHDPRGVPVPAVTLGIPHEPPPDETAWALEGAYNFVNMLRRGANPKVE